MRVRTDTFKGVGQMYIGPRDKSGPMYFIGNAKDVTQNVELQDFPMVDYTQPGGGEYNNFSRPVSANLSFAAMEITPENLANAVKGLLSIDAAAAVASEEIHTWAGGFSATKFMVDTTVAVTAALGGITWAATTAYALDVWANPVNGHLYKVTAVTAPGESGATEPVWPTDGSDIVDGDVTWTDMGAAAAPVVTDWTVTHGGFIMNNTITGLLDGAPIAFSYTKEKTFLIEALTTSGIEYELAFVGWNEAEEDREFMLNAWRCKLASTGVPFIAEGYSETPFVVNMLKDSTKGAGESAFFKSNIKWEE